MFDADTFMQTTVDSAGSTELPVTPEGEFRVVVGEVTSNALKSIDVTRKDGTKEARQVLSIPFIIRDQEINAKSDRETIVHYETYWLDFTPEGKLDMGEGKNVNLNKLRDVLDQNRPGWSPLHLSNAGPFMIAVKHKAGTGNNEGKTFVNISKYAKIT